MDNAIPKVFDTDRRIRLGIWRQLSQPPFLPEEEATPNSLSLAASAALLPRRLSVKSHPALFPQTTEEPNFAILVSV